MTALNWYLLVGLTLTEVNCLDPGSEVRSKPRLYLICVLLWPLVVFAVICAMMHGGGNNDNDD